MLRNRNLDFAGFITSTLCALHCSALPMFLSMGMLESSHWLHNVYIDVTVVGLGVLIAVLSLQKEYKKHRSLFPIAISLTGFSLLMVSLIHHHSMYHFYLSVIGGILVAASHFYNRKLSLTFSCAV